VAQSALDRTLLGLLRVLWRSLRFAFRSFLAHVSAIHGDASMPETVGQHGCGRAGSSDVSGNPLAHRPVGSHHLR